MRRMVRVLWMAAAMLVCVANLEAATLEIYRDGAIYRYVPVDDYIGFLSRGEARCGDREIALMRRPTCPESKRLCKEKGEIEKIRGKLEVTRETLKVLTGIEKAIKPTELSADKWISAAEKAGAKRAELAGAATKLQRELQAGEEAFSRLSSASEPLFLSRACKNELTLTLPAGLIELDIENEATLLKENLLKVSQFLSLTNRSGVDISVKDARIYVRDLHQILRPIRFYPWIVRPAPPKSSLRNEASIWAMNGQEDRVMPAAAPAPSIQGVQRLTARNYAVGKLDLPSTGESVRVKLSEYQVRSDCSDIAYPYRESTVYRACRFQPREEIVSNRWSLKKGRRVVSDRIYGEYAEGGYLLYVDRDESIKLRRERLPEKEQSSGIFGGQIRKKDGFIIELNNASAAKKSLTLIDRIPHSITDRIKVKFLELKGAKKMSLDEKGKLTMKVDLAPNEHRKVTVLFELRYDKGMKVNY